MEFYNIVMPKLTFKELILVCVLFIYLDKIIKNFNIGHKIEITIGQDLNIGASP